MRLEIIEVLAYYKAEVYSVTEATDKILSLMGENKNRLTGVSADNKEKD